MQKNIYVEPQAEMIKSPELMQGFGVNGSVNDGDFSKRNTSFTDEDISSETQSNGLDWEY